MISIESPNCSTNKVSIIDKQEQISKHTQKLLSSFQDSYSKQRISIVTIMGNLTPSADTQEDTGTSPLRISLDFRKHIDNDLKQLTNWSLQEIRDIYSPFRKRKGSPVLNRSEFLRLIRLSKISSFYIYNHLCKADGIIVFEIISALILLSHSTSASKVQFLFQVFDLRGRRTLQFSLLTLMFRSLVRGYALVTGQPVPDHNLLEKYGQNMFSKADLNNDQSLELSEVLQWFGTNVEASQFFNRFEPKVVAKEGYHIFNSFMPYTESEIVDVVQRIDKIYHAEKLTAQDYASLNISKANMTREEPSMRNSVERNYSTLQMKGRFNMTSSAMLPNIKAKKTLGKSFLASDKENYSTQIPQVLNPLVSQPVQPLKRFRNIIIIKGKTITKKDIFELREYFDRMSTGKKNIAIEDFIESFSAEKYSHMKSVAASLFNFLDSNKSGKVTFHDLLHKLYPNLTRDQLALVDSWNEAYNASFNLERKMKAKRQNDESKKRVLPKSCLGRFKEFYEFFDADSKGYVVYEDLVRVLGDVSSEAQLKTLFQKNDKDKDNKLTINEFVHVLLPQDLQIEGLIG